MEAFAKSLTPHVLSIDLECVKWMEYYKLMKQKLSVQINDGWKLNNKPRKKQKKT